MMWTSIKTEISVNSNIKVVVTGRKLPSWKVYQGLNDTMGMWEHKNQHENLPPESSVIDPSGLWPS